MTIQEALDYESFAAWLGTYPATAIGIPGQSAACPLAIYLRETVSLDAVTVTRTEIKWRATTVPLPTWAAQFVMAVDGQTAALTGTEAGNILLLALERARHQRAKSWELRSSTTLAELLAERGQRDAARELLAPIYNWFTKASTQRT